MWPPGHGYHEAGARQVVRESAGYPYFLQEYGLELWNHAEHSPIGETFITSDMNVSRRPLPHMRPYPMRPDSRSPTAMSLAVVCSLYPQT